jgi:serine/threonine-protein kinase HipA
LSINPASISELTRLGIVGDSGLGALTYAPSLQQAIDVAPFTLDELAQDAMGILTSGSTENLDTLFELGGSSGGARPKIMTVIDGQDWIIKFCSRLDSLDCGAREYTYSLCAKACGIDMSETRLFESDLTEGYFGTRRFDRTRCEDDSIRRIHTVSVSALLETSHRYPSLDYQSLMTLTRELTRDFSQVEQQFRRMCFNVYAHNRDDHAKNFAFQYYDGSWRLSPAYDLTYSNSIGGEHATSVNGNGKNPNDEDLISVAISAGLGKKRAVSIAEAIKGTVFEMLGMVHTGLC